MPRPLIACVWIVLAALVADQPPAAAADAAPAADDPAPATAAGIAADHAGWFSGEFDWLESPVDLRFLDPAKPGEHGFLGVRDGHLAFEDGTPARFWGTTVAGDALYGRDRERMAKHAERLAKLGFNLVRIRHQDSPWVRPNLYLDGSPDTQQKNDEAVDALDFFIAACIKAGLYVHYDMQVGRAFRPGDNVPGFAEMSDSTRHRDGEGKGYCYFNGRIQDLMKAWHRDFWSHVNPYLGHAYRDEPGMALTVITSENDLTTHYGDLMLADRGNPYHRQLFLDDVRQFTADKPFDTETAARTDQPGPAKLYLNWREGRFFSDMLADLRGDGCRIPVSGTDWCSSAWDLPALATMDVLVAQAYAHADQLSVDPLREPTALASAALARIAGKPFVLGAWNAGYPLPRRAAAMLQVAAMARLQDWDAVTQDAYWQESFDKSPARVDGRGSAFDPALMGMAPAAALLFRRGDARAATKTLAIVLPADRIHAAKTGADELPALRTGVERHRVVVALEHPPEGLTADATTSGDALCIDPGSHDATSDTGEIHRDWLAGWQTIATPRTVAAQGRIGGRSAMTVGSATFAITTPFAVVCLQSLTDEPISHARRLLLSVCARVETDGFGTSFRSEPVTGTIAFPNDAPSLRLSPLDPEGALHDPRALPMSDGTFTITLTPADKTHWFVIEP